MCSWKDHQLDKIKMEIKIEVEKNRMQFKCCYLMLLAKCDWTSWIVGKIHIELESEDITDMTKSILNLSK